MSTVSELKLKSLKEFAKTTLPPNTSVRELIMSEPDNLSDDEFRVKAGMWMKLLKKDLAIRHIQG
jgi:hypothetical protein